MFWENIYKFALFNRTKNTILLYKPHLYSHKFALTTWCMFCKNNAEKAII